MCIEILKSDTTNVSLHVNTQYTQYGPIKNGRIKNQGSDFEKNKEPALRILDLKNRFTF